MSRFKVDDRIKVQGAHQRRGKIQGMDSSSSAYDVVLDDEPKIPTVYLHAELDPENDGCVCASCLDAAGTTEG